MPRQEQVLPCEMRANEGTKKNARQEGEELVVGTPAMSETILGAISIAEIALVARIIVYDIAGASVLVIIFQKMWWQPREYCDDQACSTVYQGNRSPEH